MELLLIRHAENEYTRTGKLAGRMPGVHLNETGRKQALALAERLKAAPIRAVYASPLERARETAQPLAEAKKLGVEICAGLSEIDFGGWAGRSLKVLARTNLWRQVQQQPSRMIFPEGESFWAAQGRAVQAVEQLARDHPKELIAAVTHADVIKLVIAHYLGQPLDLFQRLVISPASITLLHLGQGQPALVKLNDTGALDGPGHKA